ncbi:MAG: hypothetical protein NVSMB9_15290 [Isosphaeraceae bacterium]
MHGRSTDFVLVLMASRAPVQMAYGVEQGRLNRYTRIEEDDAACSVPVVTKVPWHPVRSRAAKDFNR